MCDQTVGDIPLPSGWSKNVKSAVLHVISLANFAIVSASGWAVHIGVPGIYDPSS